MVGIIYHHFPRSCLTEGGKGENKKSTYFLILLFQGYVAVLVFIHILRNLIKRDVAIPVGIDYGVHAFASNS